MTCDAHTNREYSHDNGLLLTLNSNAVLYCQAQAHSGSGTQAHSGSVSQNNEHVPRNEISRKRIHSDSEETDGPLRKKIKDSRDENAEFIAQAIECNYEGVDDLRRELEQGLKTIKQKA